MQIEFKAPPHCPHVACPGYGAVRRFRGFMDRSIPRRIGSLRSFRQRPAFSLIAMDYVKQETRR